MPLLYRFLLLFTALAGVGFGQVPPSGREPDPTRWINPAQPYVRLSIAQPGIYRLTTAGLQQAGISVGTLNPRTVQVFYRGVEQAIYVDGEADGRFDADDFIEFYGRGSDGRADSSLYRPRHAQPHPYYSLFSDTTAYFLTWRPDGRPGRRMTAYADTDDTGLTPEPYHWEEELRVFTDNYPGYATGIPPKIEYSHYEAGEGYTGVVQQKGKPYENLFVLRNAVRDGIDSVGPRSVGPRSVGPRVVVGLVGREYTDHLVDGFVGAPTTPRRLLDSARFSQYHNARIAGDVAWTDVGTDGRLSLSTLSRSPTNPHDRYSVSFIRLLFPQRLVGNDQPVRLYRLVPNARGRSLLSVEQVPAGSRFWDVTDPSAPIRVGSTNPSATTARLVVRGTDTHLTGDSTGWSRVILSTDQPQSVAGIVPVSFPNWAGRRPTYVIVTHETLMGSVGTPTNAVRDYAAYRASAAGGGHDTLTATMQQLFDQFSYGERHPLAIRRFAEWLLRQRNDAQTQPPYLLLLGRSRSTPGVRRNPRQAALDLVMTAGFPGSDVVFTAGLAGYPTDVPALPTGRINAGTPQEVLNYLDKVKEYEALPTDAPWRKNVLHLSGGATPDEVGQFRSLVDVYRTKALGPALGARVTTIGKRTDNVVETINVAGPVNDGVGLMTFFGHSGLDVTDLDVGFCSNDALGYQNRGKYPLMLINGCAIGNFFFGRPTLATDWVLTPGRGAIAALAQSHLGYVSYLDQYTTTFYNLLTDSTFLHRSLGHLQQETIRRVLAGSPDGWSLANCQQMVLQGDPAIRLFPFETPDYAPAAGGLRITGADGQPLTVDSDSVRITAVVQNFGQYRAGPLPVRVGRWVNGRESVGFNRLLPRAVAHRDTLTLVLPNERDAEGLNQFEVTINPAGSLPERNQTNNRARIELNLPGHRPVLIYPAPGSVVPTATVRLTADYGATGTHRFELEVDSSARFDSPVRWVQRLTSAAGISYPTRLTRPRTTYYWRVRRIGGRTAADSAWAVGSFVYAPDSPAAGLPEGQLRQTGVLPTDIRQGDVVDVPAQFTNLSSYPFADSLVVRQTIYGSSLTGVQTTQWRVKAPAPGDTLRLTARVATDRLPGLNRLLLTVNPRLQPEQSFYNNTLDVLLPVQPDALGPVLEVAIDGRRPDSGAVVSAQPVIDVLVADDNRALLRRDTTGVAMFLQRPDENQPFERLSWRNATVQPAGADNVFRVRYASPPLAEGLYHLLVTARDAVGNGAAPYQTRFRVVHERSLTHVAVYPNPFRDRVFLSVRLTGAQAPGTLGVTIRDLTGRVVRHLRLPGRVGLNESAWDGRSDAGALLPPGVYFYQLGLGSHEQDWPSLDWPGLDWPVADEAAGKLRGRLVLIR